MVLRRFASALLVIFACAALASHAYAQNHVKASLVAAETSVQPGRAFTVALRLEHEKHWHTYWINPGTGYPTSAEWTLPAGWQAGEINWPVPIIIKDSRGTVTGNGYEGVAYLPITLTPPADAKPGETVTLRAKAEWLMCADTCVPGSAELTLALPIAAETPKPHAGTSAALAALPMPEPPKGWNLDATRTGATVTLTLVGSEKITSPHFFSPDALIQYDQPQHHTAAAGKITLTLPVSSSYEGKAERLTGVLAFTDAAGKYRGYTIDVPLAATSNAASGSQPSTLNSQPSSSSPSQLSTLNPQLSLTTLALAFLGGLILNLMPCVFPVLGIKILGFVNQAGADRRKVTLHGIVFTLGVLASFWALAGLLAVLRAGGGQLGWGFQLQSPLFVFLLAAVMLIFALSMSGVFEFGLRATAVGADLQSKSGYTGSFFTGVLATVVATPCSAPFLAPALGAALALPTAQSFVVFTVIALGLSAPYLLLSIFPGAVKILPRPGAWMETFKQFMAFPLYATVAALVWVLAGQTSEGSLLTALLGLTVIAMAVWLYGRYTAPGAKPGRVRFGVIGGLALLAAGAWIGWPQKPAPTDLVWEKWSPDAVANAQAAGKPVYVDFTARWCATCQTNKKVVFASDDVKKLFRDKGVVALKADWTNQDPQITAELAKYGRSAVPFNLVYKPGTPQPVVLPELLTPGIVLDALKGRGEAEELRGEG
jgi:thiol:disulfide interchange protein